MSPASADSCAALCKSKLCQRMFRRTMAVRDGDSCHLPDRESKLRKACSSPTACKGGRFRREWRTQRLPYMFFSSAVSSPQTPLPPLLYFLSDIATLPSPLSALGSQVIKSKCDKHGPYTAPGRHVWPTWPTREAVAALAVQAGPQPVPPVPRSREVEPPGSPTLAPQRHPPPSILLAVRRAAALVPAALHVILREAGRLRRCPTSPLRSCREGTPTRSRRRLVSNQTPRSRHAPRRTQRQVDPALPPYATVPSCRGTAASGSGACGGCGDTTAHGPASCPPSRKVPSPASMRMCRAPPHSRLPRCHARAAAPPASARTRIQNKSSLRRHP